MKFKLKSQFAPKGDQPDAINALVSGINNKNLHQVLLGVTGSGKTFTMANVIEQVQMPTLIISHNKTLAGQLFQEFKEFFPDNAVEYFVSFYDYYQPEAYIPSSDTYIEKTAEINDEIDRLRLKATSSLLSRRDVIIVASVSCIYNIGSPDTYSNASVEIAVGKDLERDEFLKKLFKMHYTRNNTTIERGCYRVRGDVIEVFPAYEEYIIRIETFGSEVEKIMRIDPIRGNSTGSFEKVTIFPAKHFNAGNIPLEDALNQIRFELDEQVALFESLGKIVEAQRLKQRTLYDIEMLREVGYVNGIENYSRILDGREPGSRPFCLLDFFEPPYLTIIDESHVTIPQIGGMFNGDRARKSTLIEHGFRIPSALDNRPLKFNEFENMVNYVIYSSATPADYELGKTNGEFVEQIIRPTGLVDPAIEVCPATNQVDDLIGRLKEVVERKERVLVTTLTKKMAEDLSEYLRELDFKVLYLHSEIDTLERTNILKKLREGVCDILIGINLLREGLDLPEVSLVAILDADKEGFLRSTRSLIQIAGRAARNVNGKVIFYADTITKSIQKTLDETSRRRKKQLSYNKKNNITPKTVTRKIADNIVVFEEQESNKLSVINEKLAKYGAKNNNNTLDYENLDKKIKKLENEMRESAKNLDFEKAATIRDIIKKLKSNQ